MFPLCQLFHGGPNPSSTGVSGGLSLHLSPLLEPTGLTPGRERGGTVTSGGPALGTQDGVSNLNFIISLGCKGN